MAELNKPADLGIRLFVCHPVPQSSMAGLNEPIEPIWMSFTLFMTLGDLEEQ